MNIVTLLPSATEIVCRLGLESNLVGISHECDFPPSVSSLPRLTRSRVDHKASTRIIHHTVEELIRKSVSVYELDLEQLAALKPNFVITQDICDVCAIPFQEVESACRTYLGGDTRIISLRPHRLEDIWLDMERVARALDAIDSYRQFRENVNQRVEFIRDRILSSSPRPKRVLTIEWMDPVMVGGMWLPEMIEIAGGLVLCAEAGEHAPVVNREELEKLDPEVVVVKPCGFKLAQTIGELDLLKNAAPWDAWLAGQHNNVYLVDGNAYFNRPGPRIIDSLEILACSIHPELFPDLLQQYQDKMVRLGPNLQMPHEKQTLAGN